MTRLWVLCGVLAVPLIALAGGTHYRGVHYDTSNGAGISSGSVVMDGPLSFCVIDQTADDTTPSIGVTSGCTADTGGNIMLTAATNTGATAITTFDDEATGQIFWVVAGGGANPTTIADGGNFSLQSDWTGANTDDVLELFVQGANDFVEVSRGTKGDFFFGSDVIIDASGTNVDSGVVAFRGDASGVEIEGTIGLEGNAGDPHIMIAVDDDTTTPVLTDVMEIHDTAVLFTTDNTVDIGAAGATRPKDIYASGTLTCAAGDFGDGSVANVGDIAVDSVSPDATNISITIGAGELGIGDGTYSSGYGANVLIEGVTEMDDALWVDDFIVVGNDGSAANVIMRASSNTFDFRNSGNTDYANVQGESYKEFGTGFIGLNGETITNNTNGAWTLAGVGSTNNEDLTISMEAVADTVQLSSSTGVVNLDTGALAVSATGLDAGDSAITNVSDIGLDSITPDATNISITIGAGELGIGDGTYSSGHSANVLVEGVLECDSMAYFDAGATVSALTASGDLTLQNGETISNATNQKVTFAANDGQAEDLSIDLGGTADTAVLSSSTGVTTIDTGAIGLITNQVDSDGEIYLGAIGGSAAEGLLYASSGSLKVRDTGDSTYISIWGGTIKTFTTTGFVGSNNEQWNNATNGAWTMAGVGGTNNEDLTFSMEAVADTVQLSSSTGVVNLDTGALAVSATGLDAGDAAITNVSDIAVDSITPDATNISVTIGAGELGIGDGTYAFGHSPNVGIEGIAEVDGNFFADALTRLGSPSSADANYIVHANTATSGGGIRMTDTGGHSNYVFQRDTVTPADGDIIGQILWNHDDSGAAESEYARIAAEVQVPTAASEDGIMRLSVTDDGSSTEYLRLDATTNVESVVLSKPLVVPTFTKHLDIPIGAALLGPTAPSRVEQDDLDYYQVDPGDELNTRFEVPDQWDGASDLEIEIYIATVSADVIQQNETIIASCDYRVISWGTDTTEGGNAVAVTVTDTYTEASNPGTDKSTHILELVVDYDHANHPVSAGDDIVIRCTDGGGTYTSSPLWSKIEVEVNVTGIPNH